MVKAIEAQEKRQQGYGQIQLDAQFMTHLTTEKCLVKTVDRVIQAKATVHKTL